MPLSNLLSNPLHNPLFLPFLLSVLGILGLGLLTIVVKERSRLELLSSNSLFVRWRTWAFIAPVAILSVFSGLLPLAAITTLVAIVGLEEFANITGLSQLGRLVMFGCALALIAAVCVGVPILPVLVLALLAVAVSVMYESNGTGFEKAAFGVIGLVWIPLLGSHAILISRLPGGPGLLLALITASGLSNVMAFVFGKNFGKRKLAPTLSPNKTWAGAGGTLVGASLGLAATSLVMPALPLAVWLALPPVITVAGISGDLFESLMKRTFNVKDAASWLPGFGGILDRIDGLLFVLPSVYYLLVLTSSG